MFSRYVRHSRVRAHVELVLPRASIPCALRARNMFTNPIIRVRAVVGVHSRLCMYTTFMLGVSPIRAIVFWRTFTPKVSGGGMKFLCGVRGVLQCHWHTQTPCCGTQGASTGNRIIRVHALSALHTIPHRQRQSIATATFEIPFHFGS